ncbi:MAG: N-acetylmuramyl-L-alanine amidase [Nitrospina sp.]|jgi:N-acetylmuramoyl-L-alanine amidase|nr:N-acetylmuramyl-L-alanine amidase [Nitrospina sp.]MBT6601898.1 N-acetylmuramyl-L-alanine amidase [Nitrospina sp.]
MNQNIVACQRTVEINSPVILWDAKGGLDCPNRRGRSACTQHNSTLNNKPSQHPVEYSLSNPDKAYDELKNSVYQLIIHYDACYSSHHCHKIMKESSFKGSHFYLDLDGTLFQTCDLYWKTNTAPADDRNGNERAVHVEMANLSWEALKLESEFHKVSSDQYRKKKDRWELSLSKQWKKKLRTPNFRAYAARGYGKRGYFSRRINGKIVRMWDFTNEQYRALINLCFGLNKLLPKIRLQVPYDKTKRRTPLDRINNYSTFEGILGHAHVQKGEKDDISCKYDPGSAFNWPHLRRSLYRKRPDSVILG